MSGYENSSTFLTSHNESAVDELLEFPLWKPLVAVNIILFVGILVPITFFINLSVFAALVKTDNTNKPLLVLFGSLLIGLCIDKLIICLSRVINSPGSIRYCICLNLVISLFSAPRAFLTVYSVVTVTCQSVLQLLIIKGRTKWKTSYKRSFACVLLSATVSVLWTTLFVTSGIVSGSPAHCEIFCATPGNSTFLNKIDFEFIVVASYSVITVAPAFIVTLVMSVWALVLFKRQIILKSDPGDISLNRKLILLPLLMAILLVCNSLLGYILTLITGEVLKGTSREPFSGNWAYFASDVKRFILDLLQGLSYPLILVYLNNAIRATWKGMLRKIATQAKYKLSSCSQ